MFDAVGSALRDCIQILMFYGGELSKHIFSVFCGVHKCYVFLFLVFWGGREGYHSLLNTDVLQEQNNMASFFRMAAGKETLLFQVSL